LGKFCPCIVCLVVDLSVYSPGCDAYGGKNSNQRCTQADAKLHFSNAVVLIFHGGTPSVLRIYIIRIKKNRSTLLID
jgi:hypothetical protein